MAEKKQETKTKRTCYFCENNEVPDYKNPDALKYYVSARAKIRGSDRTGTCAKHQRMLSREIKRARHLGLLPYTITI